MAKSSNLGGVLIGVPPPIQVGLVSKNSASVEVSAVDTTSLAVGKVYISDVSETEVEVNVSLVDPSLILVSNVAYVEYSEVEGMFPSILSPGETLDTEVSGAIIFPYALPQDRRLFVRAVLVIDGFRVNGPTIEVFLKSATLPVPSVAVNPNTPAKPVAETVDLIEGSWPEKPAVGIYGGLGFITDGTPIGGLNTSSVPLGELSVYLSYPARNEGTLKGIFTSVGPEGLYAEGKIDIQFASDAGFTDILYTEADMKNWGPGPTPAYQRVPTGTALPHYEKVTFGDGYTSTDIPIGSYYLRARVTGGLVGKPAKTSAWSDAIQVEVVDLGVAFASSIFMESTSNDGTIQNEIEIDLVGTTFTAGVVSGSKVSASNVPGGLTAVFTRTSDTKLTLALTGTASAHTTADNVSNLTVTFIDGAFEGYTAAQVPNAVKSDLQVTYRDSGAVSLSYSGTLFEESVLDDGSVGNTITITLTNDTFTADVIDHITAYSVPIGLTSVFTRDSDTQITWSLTGNASFHFAGDSGILPLSFADEAFENTLAINVVGSYTTDTYLSFTGVPGGGGGEATVSYSMISGAQTEPIGLTFEENLTYDGTTLYGEGLISDPNGLGVIGTFLQMSLQGDTFSPTVVSANLVTASNVPAGLTASFERVGDTIIYLRLTGTATSHASTDSITDLGIIFADGAFNTHTTASDVIGYSQGSIGVKYFESALQIVNNLVETNKTTGVVDGMIRFYQESMGAPYLGLFESDVVSNNYVSVTGVPTGLVPVWTYINGSEVQLTFTGAATDHSQRVVKLSVAFDPNAFQSSQGYKNANCIIAFTLEDAPAINLMGLPYETIGDIPSIGWDNPSQMGILAASSNYDILLPVKLELGLPDDNGPQPRLEVKIFSNFMDPTGSFITGDTYETADCNFAQELGVWYAHLRVMVTAEILEPGDNYCTVKGYFGGVLREGTTTIVGNSLNGWSNQPSEITSGLNAGGTFFLISLVNNFEAEYVGGEAVLMEIGYTPTSGGVPVTTYGVPKSMWENNYDETLAGHVQGLFLVASLPTGLLYFRARFGLPSGKGFTRWVDVTSFNNV